MGYAGAALAVTVGSLTAAAQTAPITLSVDLTDAPRKILHATEVMPVKAGPLTVVYPKWIPGEHGPTGPIENMTGFFITANGQPVKWERDKVDMFAYHLTVPQGVTKLEMKIEFLASSSLSGFSAGGSTSENLALLSWNTLLVYPADTNASEVMFTPSITIPAGWNFGTALDKDSGTGQISRHRDRRGSFCRDGARYRHLSTRKSADPDYRPQQPCLCGPRRRLQHQARSGAV